MKRHHQPMVKVEIKPVANLGSWLSLEWQSKAPTGEKHAQASDYDLIARRITSRQRAVLRTRG